MGTCNENSTVCVCDKGNYLGDCSGDYDEYVKFNKFVLTLTTIVNR
jgi:hypothetical protein